VEINTHRVRAGDLAEVELERIRLAALQFQNQVRKSESALVVAGKELQALLGRSLQERGKKSTFCEVSFRTGKESNTLLCTMSVTWYERVRRRSREWERSSSWMNTDR